MGMRFESLGKFRGLVRIASQQVNPRIGKTRKKSSMQTENSVPVHLTYELILLHIEPDNADRGNGITFGQFINRIYSGSGNHKIFLDLCKHTQSLVKGEIRFSEGTKKHLKVWVQYGGQAEGVTIPDRYTLVLDPSKLDDKNIFLFDKKTIVLSLPYSIV